MEEACPDVESFDGTQTNFFQILGYLAQGEVEEIEIIVDCLHDTLAEDIHGGKDNLAVLICQTIKGNHLPLDELLKQVIKGRLAGEELL